MRRIGNTPNFGDDGSSSFKGSRHDVFHSRNSHAATRRAGTVPELGRDIACDRGPRCRDSRARPGSNVGNRDVQVQGHALAGDGRGSDGHSQMPSRAANSVAFDNKGVAAPSFAGSTTGCCGMKNSDPAGTSHTHAHPKEGSGDGDAASGSKSTEYCLSRV